MVVAGLFGPFDNFVKVSNPTYDGSVFRGEYLNADSVALAHEFVLCGSSILCVNPNELRKKLVIDQVESTTDDDSQHQKVIMAGMSLGSTQFVRDLIEQDEKLNAEPISTHTKIDSFGDYQPRKQPNEEAEGWLQETGQVNDEEETTNLSNLETETQWDTSTRRKMIHFGYSFDKSGNNVSPAPPIPEYLHEIQSKLQRWLSLNDIQETLNQCSVHDYEPNTGVSPNIDQPCMGPVIATVNLLSDTTIDFLPKGEGTPFSNRALRHSFIAITCGLRSQWRHGITPRDDDMVDGTKVMRPKRISLVFRSIPAPPKQDAE